MCGMDYALSLAMDEAIPDQVTPGASTQCNALANARNHSRTHAHTICCLSQRALYNRAGFAHRLQALGIAPDWPVLQLLELIDRDNCNHRRPSDGCTPLIERCRIRRAHRTQWARAVPSAQRASALAAL